KTFSDAPRATPDTFASSAPVLFNLRLTDVATGAFTDLHFNIKFTGTVSSDATGGSPRPRIASAPMRPPYTAHGPGNTLAPATRRRSPSPPPPPFPRPPARATPSLPHGATPVPSPPAPPAREPRTTGRAGSVRDGRGVSRRGRSRPARTLPARPDAPGPPQ